MFEKAVQSLSQIEDKLRRAFGLAGPIGAKLVPDLTPVLIAGDLREPGHAYHQGRCWSVCQRSLAFAADSYYAIRFDVDVLVEGIQITGNPVDTFDVYTTIPGQTISQVIAAANGSWRDRRTLVADVPPIQSAAAAGGLAGGGTVAAASNRIWGGRVSAVTLIPQQIMLVSGSALNFHAVAGSADAAITVWGRVW